MLVAYGPDGCSVLANEASLEQLQRWSRERMLFCPNCRGVLHVRGGPEKRLQLHFAHQKGECAWSTESESVRHATGKLVLSHWLRTQFPTAIVTLEERLPEPNRIADVLLTHADGTRWAIEFQCAPLDLEEWRHRHTAYRNGHIQDIWIVGNNRREKQEAFIEAILATFHETMFLDPLITPPRIELRWPVSREMTQTWQHDSTWHPALKGWVGRLGYGATLSGHLHQVSLEGDGQMLKLLHPMRTTLEKRTHILHEMSNALTVDETLLEAYISGQIDVDIASKVLLPLLRAYLRDPDLLRRYNYGRGRADAPTSEADQIRVQKAMRWLLGMQQRGFTTLRFRELASAIPFIGPYAAFARYIEMLLMLEPSR